MNLLSDSQGRHPSVLLPIRRGVLVRALPWSAVAILTAILYALTASDGIGWQDFGEFVLRIYDPQLMQEWGLARWHPLHYMLSRLSAAALPSHPPFAVALVSGIFGAISVANVYGIVRQFTARYVPALLSATALALSHTFWRLATHPECYTISTALLTAEIWALVLWSQTTRQRWLILMMFCNGMGLANHNLALLTLPILAVVLGVSFRKRKASVTTALTAVAAWVVGASPYLALIIQQALVTGDVAQTIRSALVGNFERQALGLGFEWRNTAASIAFTLLSFPNFILPAAVLGIARARQTAMPPLVGRVLLAALLVHLIFVLRYNVSDQYTFLLPAYVIVAIFAGVGLDAILDGWKGSFSRWILPLAAASVLLTPAVYVAAKTSAEHYQILGNQARNKPYRNDYQYLFIPWGSGDNSAAQMSTEAVALAGPQGMIAVEDQMGSFAVRYQIIHLRQTGIEEVDGSEHARIGQAVASGRTVVFVPSRADGVPPPLLATHSLRRGEFWVLKP